MKVTSSIRKRGEPKLAVSAITIQNKKATEPQATAFDLT